MPTGAAQIDSTSTDTEDVHRSRQFDRCRRGICLVLLSCLATQTIGCYQWKPRTTPRIGIVLGSSMSPTLLGEHYIASCGECRIEFACDPEQADQREFLICANCGARVRRSTCKKHGADSVNVQTGGFSIERWDVVAFQVPQESTPTDGGSAGIKRIVGLPGESIAFRNGNLLADGNIVRKDLGQQKAMRILVHDSLYRSERDRSWSLAAGSGWDASKTFTFQPVNNSDKIQWFKYLNQRNYSHPARQETQPDSFSFEDFYAYNQSLSRDLNSLDEIFVAMDVQNFENSLLAWRFDHRGNVHEFQIDTGQQTLRVSDSSSPSKPLTVNLKNLAIVLPVSLVEFSSIDLQLQVWINGQKIFQREMLESEAPVSNQPLMFGAAKSQLELGRIRIWRDLYYYSDSAQPPPLETRVDRTGYFVIGDNVPISVDSRHWRSPTLPKSSIIGTVKLP